MPLPDQVEPDRKAVEHSDTAIAFVKSQPVQPWSASPGFPAFDAEFETTLEQEPVSAQENQASWTTDLLAETAWMTDLPSDASSDAPSDISKGQSLSRSASPESPEAMEALYTLEDELNRAQAPQRFVERSSSDRVIAPIPKANALSYTIKHAAFRIS